MCYVIFTCRLWLLRLSNGLGIIYLYWLINKCLAIGSLNELCLWLLLNINKTIISIQKTIIDKGTGHIPEQAVGAIVIVDCPANPSARVDRCSVARRAPQSVGRWRSVSLGQLGQLVPGHRMAASFGRRSYDRRCHFRQKRFAGPWRTGTGSVGQNVITVYIF